MKNLLTLSFMLLLFTNTTFCQLTWEHTGGPNGGSLSRIYNTDTYAFYPDENYLYRTSDGQNWEQLPQQDIWPMATYNNKLAAQFNVNYGAFYNYPPKFKVSYDNGETWIERTYPTQAGYFSDITWCSHGIYIPSYSDGVIYRSTDDGQSWSPITLSVPYVDKILAFEDKLYISDYQSFWVSDTNGENWENIQIPLTQNEYINTFFAQAQHILIASNEKIWQSHDSGATWTSQGAPWSGDFENLIMVNGDIYLTGGGSRIARTSDFGVTWDLLIDDESYDLNLFYTATVNGKLLGTTYSRGVYRYDEASNQMVESNHGLASAVVYNLTIGGSKLWASCGNGIFSHDLNTGTWADSSVLPAPEHFYEFLSANNNGLVCASSWLSGQLLLSSDYGQSWNEVMPFNDPFGINSVDNAKIIGDYIFASKDFDYQVARSSDQGATWEMVDNPYLIVSNIVEFNGQLLTNDYSNIYASTDGGLTWQVFGDFPQDYIYSFTAVGDRLFAESNAIVNGQTLQVLYTSTDGINWDYSHDGLPTEASFLADPFSSGYPQSLIFNHSGIYFGYAPSFGLYGSLDSCKTWLPVDRKRASTIVATGGEFYAGSFGGGVMRTTIPTDIYGELVQGTVFKDDNNNGIQDAAETALPNIKVTIDQGSGWYPFYFSTTDINGHYILGITPNQQDTLRPWLNSSIVENINPPFYIANSGGTKNFGIHLTPGIHDLSVIGNNGMRPRPGFDYWSYVRVDNLGSENEPTTASLKLDGDLTFISATPAPTSIIGDSLVWDLSTIPVFNGENIVVKTNVPATTPLGNWVINTWRVTTTNNDINLANNVYVTADTVVGSFDPNEKIVEPATGLSEAEIAAGKELLYTIRFQNTGTFPAERVRITDLLDTALYLPSVRLVAASHPVTSFNLKPGGLLEVLFDNIQLPDSTNNEPASHGFVTFAVQRNKAYNKDFPVRNTASIYFDFNEPIFTNEVSFTVNPDNVSSTHEARPKQQDEALLIFPNPTAGSFTVSSKGKLSGRGNLVVVNSMGQIVEEQQVGNLSNPIRVKANELPEGIYFVKISAGKGVMSGKLVVQRGR